MFYLKPPRHISTLPIATDPLPPSRTRSPLWLESRPYSNAEAGGTCSSSSVTKPRSMAMQDQENATPAANRRVPWNKGKLTGAKPPLRPKHVWSIRTKLQIEGRCRDLCDVQSGD